MSFHKDEIGYSLHNLQAFTYADANSRLNAIGLLPVDIGKVAKQTDTNQYYILQSDNPVTWASITGSGSGSSGINYIADNNSTAADSVGDWHTYADAAGVAPVDGANAKGTGTLTSGGFVISGVPSTTGVANGQTITGVGIPSNTVVASFVVNTSITMSNPATANGAVSWSTFNLNNVTITRSTVSPLRGTASFLLTKDAANRQGQGASFDFTIDSADKSKSLSISFDYAPAGSFVAGSDLVNSDILVYVYDITNDQVIQASPLKLSTATGFIGSYNGTFQANSNSVLYRLIFHVATTNAAAWTFKFDNIRVGPGAAATFGVPVSDFVSFPMVITGSVTNPTKGTTSYDQAYWRRVGDSMEIVYSYVQTAAGLIGSGDYLFGIPTGYTIDTAKVRISSARSEGSVGAAVYGSSGASVDGVGAVKVYTNVKLGIEALNNNIALGNVGSTLSPMSDTVIKYSFRAVVPIVGWSSNVQLSSAVDNGTLVAARAGSSSTQLLVGAPTLVQFNTIFYDTVGAITTGASWNFKCPSAGKYRVNARFLTNSASASSNNINYNLYLYKNGINTNIGLVDMYAATALAYRKEGNGSGTLDCNAGDLLDLRIATTDAATHSLNGSTVDTWVEIDKLPAVPSTVAQTDTIAAAYSTAAGQSFPSGANNVVNFGTKDYDTHGAVTTGAGWNFKCPIAGKYTLSAFVGFASNASGVREMYLLRNGINIATNVTTPNGDVGMVGISYTVNCAAGDTLSFSALQNSGSTLTLQISAGALYNFVSIIRTGN